ncbi:prepilin-type N-terminal cleavage/methylation domain-containing protein [Desulfoscipio gibsoniae]
MIKGLIGLKLKNVTSNNGLTMIELLIALAILLIVLSVSYSFYFYFTRSFDFAARQSNVQQNVRLAKTIIEKEIRHASYIKIGDAPEDSNKYNQKIYIADNKIIHYVDGKNKDILDGLSNGINMRLSFKKISDNSPFLWIKVEGDINGDQEYSISSELLILGIENENFLGNVGKESQEIYFYHSPDS